MSLFKKIWIERDPAYAEFRNQVSGDLGEIIRQYPYAAPLRRRNRLAHSPYWDPIWPARLRKASAELGLDSIVVNSRMMFLTEDARDAAMQRAEELCAAEISSRRTSRAIVSPEKVAPRIAEVPSQAVQWKDEILAESLRRLYQSDSHLIAPGRERSAAARLASHMRDVLAEGGYFDQFPEMRVDTDYGREGENVKRNFFGSQVIPDVIVHVPGAKGPNIAALEIKGWWSDADHSYDKTKLAGYKSKQGYTYAYFIFLDQTTFVVEQI